ncbi:FAD-dependent oxidoreductase [Spongisporangium articulatum]|uniref:FAD-dependent oxidoreductase n=1 Tax=Spongisporangium articulatum TaxID=3362603 RepID=A0ABW8AJA4_9ACTN
MSTASVAGAIGTVLDADVCIVGGGPAGLSVALALVAAITASGIEPLPEAPRVVLLEAGDDRLVQLGSGTRVSDGNPYPGGDINTTRAHYLGGTAGIWSYEMSNAPGDPGDDDRGCRYAPMDEVDFEARTAVPHSGWPLKRGDLDPWYEKAQPVAGLGPAQYTPEPWAGPGREVLHLDDSLVETQMFQFAGSRKFTQGVVGRLRAAGVRLVTRADVTALETDGSGRVTAVRWRGSDGTTGTVNARAVVLAAGGIENSRLLLRTATAAGGDAGPGLGNTYDQVGRYWMEHPIVRGGIIVTRPGAGLAGLLGLYDAHWQDSATGPVKVMAKFSINPTVVRERGLVSTALLLLPRADAMASPGFQAFTALRSPTFRAASPLAKAKVAATVLTRPQDLLNARAAMQSQPGVDLSGWTQSPEAPGLNVFEMVHQTEQTPDPSNRIVLGRDLDAHGRQEPVLHWHWSDDDQRRVTQSRDLYAQAFANAGLGRLMQGDWDGGRPRMTYSTHHHMGGTRISPDDRTGVVDADCRVHGSPNVFVAGSSVFPTGGSVNPTLTIVALSVRLGEHLRSVLPAL